MPDLRAQLELHDGYVDLTAQAYGIWWRDEEGVKSTGRICHQAVDAVVRHLNESYYPVTFWRSPVYRWNALIEAAPAV